MIRSACVCSRQFYAGKLTDGVTAEQKPAAAGLAWPQPEQPVMVVAVQGVEEQAKKNKARVRAFWEHTYLHTQ